MNTGVEILLQRMKDNPEDFYYQPNRGGMSRWMSLVDHAIGEELLTLEEHEAIKAGLKETKRERFTELVMKELAGEGEASDEGKTRLFTNAQSGMPLGGLTLGAYSNTATATINANSLTLGKTQLQEEQVKHMIAHLDKLKREEQLKAKEAEKKHQTLFGKLFNYT